MWLRACALGSCLVLILAPALPAAEAGPTDPDVLKGIKLVDDGDYDGAILTLDNAARRLSQDPARARELSQAYLYLGIAYMGKGHEAAAKAKFREALAQIKDISLSPDKFPPKIIDAFEEARSEAARTAKAPATGPAPGPAPAPEKKKKSSKGILIGVGVAAAAGVGIAVAGGGKDGSSSSPAAPTRRTENFSGSLNTDEVRRSFTIVVSAAGNLDATASWTDAASVLGLNLLDANFAQVGPSANRTSNTTLTLVPQPVAAGSYNVEVEYLTCNGAPVQAAGAPIVKAPLPECTTDFTLAVVHP